ncbi:transcriptional regulator [Maribacter algicola]|uniref:Transcriptional regulator n=1 Tax=Maribacter algicola TaxID=2498892 RepID=A0A3R8R0X6_9FLAO|nr:transcriptional regulator [Maribacter algicola]RRQ47839.1 transcriptional regulator [Maribacter algicola]
MALCSEYKRELIEELGLYFEKRHSLPPLASRIYAIMVLSSFEGFTFEELMDITQASKSSVSTNLNLLLQLKFLEYYTRPGERKRYFRSSGSFLQNMLKERYETINSDLELTQKVNKFNQENNPENYSKKGYIGDIFHTFLVREKLNIEQTLQRIRDFKEKN